MSTPTNDGGPAFPHAGCVAPENHPEAWASEPQAGMSLRDWFAGQALAGMLSGVLAKSEKNKAGELCLHSTLSPTAYALADAMLKARDSRP